MTWFAVGATAVSVAASAYSQGQQAKSAAGQASRQSRAENDAIVEANLRNSARNSYRVGLMNLQLGQTKRQFAQAGFDRTVQAKQVLGAITANQAAAGTIGASTDAVLTDVEMRLGEAEAASLDSFELALTDFNNDLEALAMNADDAIQKERRYEYHGPSSGQIWAGAAVQGAAQFASAYASRRMTLGTGTTSTGNAANGLSSNVSSPGLQMGGSGPGLKLPRS